jgi:hypothetical protein
MTFATLSHPLCAEVGSALTVAGPRRGIFRQVIDAVADSNRRKAEREIARFIQHNGGRITDDLERAIERKFL